jgi:hypothetical protein
MAPLLRVPRPARSPTPVCTTLAATLMPHPPVGQADPGAKRQVHLLRDNHSHPGLTSM